MQLDGGTLIFQSAREAKVVTMFLEYAAIETQSN